MYTVKNYDNGCFYSINQYLKENFGEKVIKLSLDGGFTCPNRDGSKGTGGCIFCASDGSGHFAGTIPEQLQLLSVKWPNTKKYLAYFQNHTGTYAPADQLRLLYEEALSYPGVSGIAVATRPDCLSDEVLTLLDQLNKKTFLWIELGLQTIHEDTAQLINRCYPLSVFDDAVKRLAQLEIRTVVHLILGLPQETRDQMKASLKYVCTKEPFGLKLHLLNIMKDTRLLERFPDWEAFSGIDDYVEFVVDLLEEIPEDITIHRLTGDAPRNMLVSPAWSYEKRKILNGIQKEFRRRGSRQGSKRSAANLPLR